MMAYLLHSFSAQGKDITKFICHELTYTVLLYNQVNVADHSDPGDQVFADDHEEK